MSEKRPELRIYITKAGRFVSMFDNDPYTLKALASGDYKLASQDEIDTYKGKTTVKEEPKTEAKK